MLGARESGQSHVWKGNKRQEEARGQGGAGLFFHCEKPISFQTLSSKIKKFKNLIYLRRKKRVDNLFLKHN